VSPGVACYSGGNAVPNVVTGIRVRSTVSTSDTTLSDARAAN